MAEVTKLTTTGYVIDTPDGIAAWQMLRLRGALKVEIATGLHHSQGSVMNHIKRTYLPDCTKRTKRGVLADYEAFLRERGILEDAS